MEADLIMVVTVVMEVAVAVVAAMETRVEAMVAAVAAMITTTMVAEATLEEVSYLVVFLGLLCNFVLRHTILLLSI